MPKPRRRKTPPKGKFVPTFSLLFPFQFVCIFTNRRLEKGTWTVTIESPGAVRGWQVDEGKHLSIKDFEKNLNLLQIQTWRAVQNTAWFSSLDESYTIHWSRLTKLHRIFFTISKEIWNHLPVHNSVSAELLPIHLHTEEKCRQLQLQAGFRIFMWKHPLKQEEKFAQLLICELGNRSSMKNQIK